MPSKSQPIEVFVSYSHKDRKHLDKLRAHVAGLEREGRVHFWWDGELENGKAWRPQILGALQRAEVVLLLLTASFLASDFCMDEELLAAREREKRGEIDLIPILVDSFDLGSHWLGEIKAVTVDGKAVVRSHRGADAWASVVRQIRGKIESFEGRRPVLQALNEVEEVVGSGDVELGELPAHQRIAPVPYATVSAFWRARPLLEDTGLVAVRGTLSQFAPMLMGSPRAKRNLHRAFRRAIESDRRFGELKRVTINACMSISAGQMVQREVRQENRKRLLGLFEGTVRNSIPVFVLPESYPDLLATFQNGGGSGCFEAEVTGRLLRLDNNYIRRFLARQGLDAILPGYVIDDLCQDALALEVGGPGTGVKPLADQTVRYLDGDIWLAVSSEEGERFVTGFVDLADASDRDGEMELLKQEAAGRPILAAWNQLQSIAQLLEAGEE